MSQLEIDSRHQFFPGYLHRQVNGHILLSERILGPAADVGANYGHITNVGGDWKAGENTWENLPRYWDEELAALPAPGIPCPTRN